MQVDQVLHELQRLDRGRLSHTKLVPLGVEIPATVGRHPACLLARADAVAPDQHLDAGALRQPLCCLQEILK